MRCIDADALLDEVMDRHCNDCDRRKGIKNGKYRIIYSIGEAPCRACDVDDLKGEIEDAPTIEPQRKKGMWIEHNPHKWGLGIVFECSECGEKIDCEPSNFCPNCGADMRTPVDIAKDIVHKIIDNTAWSDTVDTAKMHKVVDDKYAEIRGDANVDANT